MKLVKPRFEVFPQVKTLEDVYKNIELAGRTCYKSEENIGEGTAVKFVEKMKKYNHGAMLEHGTVYLKVPTNIPSGFICDYVYNKYSVIKSVFIDDYVYITTNLRVIVENKLEKDLQYLCEPTEHHEKRVSVRFITDRVTANSLVRHRVFSFAQESTRYCNYSKDKFGNEISFTIPHFLHGNDNHILIKMLEYAEQSYFSLLKSGLKNEDARGILPLFTKTEIVMTGFVSDWSKFFDLRCDNSAHSDVRFLSKGLQDEFKKLGYD